MLPGDFAAPPHPGHGAVAQAAVAGPPADSCDMFFATQSYLSYLGRQQPEQGSLRKEGGSFLANGLLDPSSMCGMDVQYPASTYSQKRSSKAGNNPNW